MGRVMEGSVMRLSLEVMMSREWCTSRSMSPFHPLSRYTLLLCHLRPPLLHLFPLHFLWLLLLRVAVFLFLVSILSSATTPCADEQGLGIV